MLENVMQSQQKLFTDDVVSTPRKNILSMLSLKSLLQFKDLTSEELGELNNWLMEA